MTNNPLYHVPYLPAFDRMQPEHAEPALRALLAEATSEVVAAETKKVLKAMRGRPGHIFNLGHGLTPAAKLENITALVETVKNFK